MGEDTDVIGAGWVTLQLWAGIERQICRGEEEKFDLLLSLPWQKREATLLTRRMAGLFSSGEHWSESGKQVA